MVKLVDDYISAAAYTPPHTFVAYISVVPFGCCPHLQFLIFFFPFTWFEYTIKEDRSVDLYSRVLGWISFVNNRLRSRFGCRCVLVVCNREIYYLNTQVTCAISQLQEIDDDAKNNSKKDKTEQEKKPNSKTLHISECVYLNTTILKERIYVTVVI